jgi:hypothetical protein
METLKRKFENDISVLSQQLEVNQHEISVLSQQLEDSRYILPLRYQDNVKWSSVLILNKDKTVAGVGFFITNNRVISVKHNLKSYGKRFSKVFAKTYNNNEYLEEVKLTMVTTSSEYDVAVFSYSGFHNSHLVIEDVPSNGQQQLVVATFTTALSEQLSEITSFTNDGFALIPSHLVKISENHIVYLSVAFSGDSGGAVLFGPNGKVVAMHIETVNQANEEIQDVLNSTNMVLAESINSIVKGFSEGFLGLRLASSKVHQILFS